MAIAKNITTLILALLLANPACCCAWMKCGAEAETPPVRSCCAGSSEKSDDKGSQDEDHQCLCALNKQYVDQGKFDATFPDQIISPEPPVCHIQDEPLAPAHITYLPLPNRPPPGPAIRLLYSVFRL